MVRLLYTWRIALDSDVTQAILYKLRVRSIGCSPFSFVPLSTQPIHILTAMASPLAETLTPKDVKIPSATPGWNLDAWQYIPEGKTAPYTVIVMCV